MEIPTRSPRARVVVENVERAMRLTARINRLTYDDLDEVRALFGELTGQVVGPDFRLIPPFYADQGVNIRVGRKVFINQCCTIYSIADVVIGDDVMLGPNVSLITSSHPVDPARRFSAFVADPIVVGPNVWVAAGATVVGGVTIGENSVVAAGSVVTHDVPANTLVAGNPARMIRTI